MTLNVFEELQKYLSAQWTEFEVYRYSVAEHFSKLWNATVGDAREEILKKDIFIIWDGFPEDSDPNARLLVPHITPIDWAIWCAASIEQPRGVHILDCTNTEYLECFAVKYRHQILPNLDFIKLYAIMGVGTLRSRVGYLSLIDVNGNFVKPSVFGVKSSYKKQADDLLQLWRSTLDRFSDHHDLNNIVGPIIAQSIIKNGDITERSVQVPVLSSTLLAIKGKMGLCGGSATEQVTKPTFENIDKFGFIDDFDAWPKLLSGSDCHIVGCHKVADDALCGLSAIISEFTLPKMETRHFDLPPWPSSTPDEFRLQGLILDLRLFTGSKHSELTHLLIEAAKSIVGKTLAWDEITPSEIDDARSGVEPVVQSLLPRLCALRWPTLPIIIFTASANRAVLDKLRPYGNIIIGPRKPDLMVDSAAVVLNDFYKEFERVLISAEKMSQTHLRLSELVSCKIDGNARHFVLGMDEVGQFKEIGQSAIQFAILETIGEDTKTAQAASVTFQEALRESAAIFSCGPFYFETGAGGADQTEIRKGDCAFNKHLLMVLSESTTTKLHVSALHAVDDNRGIIAGRYISTICNVLEYALLELMPSISSKFTASIWIPNRLMEELDLTEAQKFDLRVHYGNVHLSGTGVGMQLLARALRRRQIPAYLTNAVVVLRMAKVVGGDRETVGGCNRVAATGINFREKDSNHEIFANKITRDKDGKCLATEIPTNNIRPAVFGIYSPVANIADEAYCTVSQRNIQKPKYIGLSRTDQYQGQDFLTWQDVEQLLELSAAVDSGNLAEAIRIWVEEASDWIIPEYTLTRARNALIVAVSICKGEAFRFKSRKKQAGSGIRTGTYGGHSGAQGAQASSASSAPTHRAPPSTQPNCAKRSQSERNAAIAKQLIAIREKLKIEALKVCVAVQNKIELDRLVKGHQFIKIAKSKKFYFRAEKSFPIDGLAQFNAFVNDSKLISLHSA